MKAIKYLSVIASMLMLASCAKEEILPEENEIPSYGRTTVTFVSSTETKTVLNGDRKTTSWDGNENVLLWEGETPLSISNKSKDGGILTLTADVENPQSLFYSVIGPGGEDNATRTSVKVLETQHPAQASFDPNAEILVAQPATCSTENTVALRYNRPVAITIATLKNLEAGEKVLTVKITADQNLTGSVNFTYEGTNVKAAMAGVGKTITCEYNTNNTVGESGEFPVYFISLNAEVKVFEFEVSTDKHKYYKKVVRPDESPIVLNDNRVASFGFKLDNADKADAEGDKFVKVTSTEELTDGTYLIVYEDGNVALNGSLTTIDAESNTVSVTISNNEITSSEAIMAAAFTYTASNGSFLGTNGKYIYHTGSKNTLDTSSEPQNNTVTFDNGNVVIAYGGGYTLRYNANSGQTRFRYYTGDSQQPIQLYKKTLGGYGLFTLHTPTNIQYDSENNKITWDAVENAGKYKISLNGGEPIECEINEYSTSELTAEYYYASVIALPSAETEDTYKQSEAGSHEGWFKIGEPKMPKLDANNITLNITKSTITASWENDPSATNGYIAEIWSRKSVETGKTDDEGNPETKLEDDELISKTDDVKDGTITFSGLTPGSEYHIKVSTKAAEITDGRGTRAYIDSDAANKYPKTSSVYTIAEIFALSSNTVACEVDNAVIYAKGESCYLVNDGTGYIMVNASAGDYAVGDKLTISGKTESYNSQKRFDSTTTIIEKTGTVTPEHPTVASFDGEFTYAKYVNIVGKTSKSGGVVSIADAAEHSLKLIDNAGLDDNQYVTVTGYLTHKTDAGYINMIVVEKHINTITVTEADGHEWENNSVSEKTFTISTDDNAEWTYELDNTTDWTVTRSGNALSVSPNAINTSTTSSKSLTITLTHSGNTMLTATIQCSQKPKPAVYEKYIDELTEGYYLITYNNGAMKNTVSSDRFGYTTITPVNDKVSAPDVSIVWKIEKSGDYWTIYNETVLKYAASTGAANKGALIESGTDDKSLWTVTMKDCTFEFVNKKNSSTKVNANLRRNTANGFACYSTSTGGALTLYKLDDGRTPQSLSFDATTGTIDLNGNVRDLPTLNASGAYTTITWSSSDETVATVDNDGTVHALKVGTTKITATAAEDATYRKATASYTLTISDSSQGGGEEEPEDILLDSNLGLSNAVDFTTVTQNGVTVSGAKGGNSNNAPKYYTSGDAVRFYAKNTMTISVTNKTITKVVITYGSKSNAITGASVGNIGSYDTDSKTQNWTGSASGSVTFTFGGTSGNDQIKSVKVTYK